MSNQPPGRGSPPIDRRGFLRTSAGGGAALFLGSLLPTGCTGDYPQAAGDGVELRALSPKQYAVARAAAEAVLVEVPVAPAVVAARIDRDLALVGAPIKGDMKTVFTLLEHSTLLNGQFGRFTALDLEARRSYLRSWAESRFNLRRAVYQAVRAFVQFYAYSDADTNALTGFRGPWPARFDIAPRPVDFGSIA